MKKFSLFNFLSLSPFQCVLPESWQQQADPFAHIMSLEGEIFRELEGRKTLRFTKNNFDYFAKLHQGVGWREIIKNLLQCRLPVLGAKQEWRAIQRLTQLGISTTPLVGYGSRGLNPARKQSFVITQALNNTVSLEDFCHNWINRPPPFTLKRAFISQIAEIARNLHTHGMNHRDFYICHFLLDIGANIHTLSANRVHLYLIDLHRMQIRRKTPLRWKIKDIAGLYFSSMNLGLTHRDKLYFMKKYSQQPLRQCLQNKKFWQPVEKRAAELYVKTYFTEKKSFRKKFTCQNTYYTSAMKDFLANPDSSLMQHRLLKNDATTTVGLIEIDGRCLVVKRYNIKGFWHGLKRGLRQSRASICWQHALRLKRLGIATATPIAILENGYGPWRTTAYYITEYIDANHAAHFFKNPTQCATSPVKMAKKIAALFSKLAGLSLSHGDMKATNILITPEGPLLIDLDSMRYHASQKSLKQAQQQDLRRFMKNWEQLPAAKCLFKQIFKHRGIV